MVDGELLLHLQEGVKRSLQQRFVSARLVEFNDEHPGARHETFRPTWRGVSFGGV